MSDILCDLQYLIGFACQLSKKILLVPKGPSHSRFLPTQLNEMLTECP